MKYEVYGMGYGLVAECKYAPDAACILTLYGPDSYIMYGGRLVWHEGREDIQLFCSQSIEDISNASDIIDARIPTVVVKPHPVSAKDHGVKTPKSTQIG